MNLKNSRFEWTCKGNESFGRKFVRILAQWGCIICFLLTMITFWALPFVIATVVCGAAWIVLFRNRKIEYDFNYLAGELTIFKISNHIRRKKKFYCTLDQIEYIQKGIATQTTTQKFYFHPEEVYSMKVHTPDENKILLIEPDERFLQILEQERKLRK